MNCKPGDLAVMVKSEAGNEGKIVRCLSFSPRHLYLSGARVVALDSWKVDQELETEDPGETTHHVPDAWLRPIRDNDQKDQTLDWAPVPTKETA